MSQDAYDARVQVDTPVTTVIRQHPLSDAVDRYEAWVNTPPPKGGGFGLRLEAEFSRPQGPTRYTTLK
jgi:hypothetical protein